MSLLFQVYHQLHINQHHSLLLFLLFLKQSLNQFLIVQPVWICIKLFIYILLSGKDVGETALYFGCRHKAEDFLYQEELEAFEKAKALTRLNVAFSRDQEHKV